MLAAGIQAQALHSVAANSVVRDHTLHSQLHSLLGLFFHQSVVADVFQMADPAGVMIVVLLLQLLAGQNSLCTVDDDYVVAAVNMGSKGGLVLAAEQHSSLSCHTAQGLTGSIDHIPLAVNLTSFGHISGHSVYLLLVVKTINITKPRPRQGDPFGQLRAHRGWICYMILPHPARDVKGQIPFF